MALPGELMLSEVGPLTAEVQLPFVWDVVNICEELTIICLPLGIHYSCQSEASKYWGPTWSKLWFFTLTLFLSSDALKVGWLDVDSHMAMRNSWDFHPPEAFHVCLRMDRGCVIHYISLPLVIRDLLTPCDKPHSAQYKCRHTVVADALRWPISSCWDNEHCVQTCCT